MSDTFVTAAPPAVAVRRHPGEAWLFTLVLAVALVIWIALAVSMIGIAYALLLGIFFFFAHVVFVAHLRGSAVRLGPEQLPDLHDRVRRIAARIGLKRVPEAYLMQAGGALNALATKFRGAGVIVLYSDLVDACDDNTDALDFIIAHELGHLKAGHLRWRWFLLPGFLIPFIGSAYSRACEYTCDRYGMAASNDKRRALDGLVVLAAGPKRARQVSRQVMAAQVQHLNTVWMKIGQWLSSHPPLVNRLASLDPSLAPSAKGGALAAVGAVATLVLLIVVPVVGGMVVYQRFGPELARLGAREFSESVAPARASREAPSAPARSSAPAPSPGPAGSATPAQLRAEVERGILALAGMLESGRQAGGGLPRDGDELYARWRAAHPGETQPMDPYSARRYVYVLFGNDYIIRSTGPDPNTRDDDLYYDSAQARQR